VVVRALGRGGVAQQRSCRLIQLKYRVVVVPILSVGCVFIVGYVMHIFLRSDGQVVNVSRVEKYLVATLPSIRSCGEGNYMICQCYSAFYPLLAVESKTVGRGVTSQWMTFSIFTYHPSFPFTVLRSLDRIRKTG